MSRYISSAQSSCFVCFLMLYYNAEILIQISLWSRVSLPAFTFWYFCELATCSQTCFVAQKIYISYNKRSSNMYTSSINLSVFCVIMLRILSMCIYYIQWYKEYKNIYLFIYWIGYDAYTNSFNFSNVCFTDSHKVACNCFLSSFLFSTKCLSGYIICFSEWCQKWL